MSDEDDACGCSECNERGGGSVDSSDGRSAWDIDIRDEFASAENGGEGAFEEMRAMDAQAQRMKCVAEPDWEREKVYAGLVERYRACEDAVVRMCAAA